MFPRVEGEKGRKKKVREENTDSTFPSRDAGAGYRLAHTLPFKRRQSVILSPPADCKVLQWCKTLTMEIKRKRQEQRKHKELCFQGE